MRAKNHKVEQEDQFVVAESLDPIQVRSNDKYVYLNLKLINRLEIIVFFLLMIVLFHSYLQTKPQDYIFFTNININSSILNLFSKN
jgi:hypothetical protein